MGNEWMQDKLRDEPRKLIMGVKEKRSLIGVICGIILCVESKNLFLKFEYSCSEKIGVCRTFLSGNQWRVRNTKIKTF